ncbi:uncharacterized protein LOC125235414 [Leguminivora glycinivorella]|uniref:uncharacterized protein LOC125235414 n=1 Tax=Leguminivora glycinivorella TaxID=1035111 RepID=UPI00200BB37E|nr:uncharacterized protein LOC125235414 [Leguminivora glycinivorella]
MGRPCTKCPSTTVQSCCGLRNLRAASLLIGFFKVLLFLAAIIGFVSIMSGYHTGAANEKEIAQKPTGQLVLALLMCMGFMFLSVVLIAGLFKKRRNYVMIYWVANWVWIALTLIGLFTQSQGVVQWIIVFCYTVADIYFQIVIRSYYLEMTGAAATPPHPQQATPGIAKY